MRTFAALAVLLVACGRLPAGVLVLANGTGRPVEFRLAADGEPRAETLAPGESRPYPCGAAAGVTFGDPNAPSALRLEPYAAYVFTVRKGALELHGVDMPGKAPPAGTAAPTNPPPKVTVKLLADDAERRTRRAWEPALRRRFEQAAAVVTAHSGVAFEVVAVDEWESPPTAPDLNAILADFEQRVPPAPAALAIGWTSRAFARPAGGPPTPRRRRGSPPVARPCTRTSSSKKGSRGPRPSGSRC